MIAGGRPPTCAVRAVRDWMTGSTCRLLTEGPLFRPINRFGKILSSPLTGQSVALIVMPSAIRFRAVLETSGPLLDAAACASNGNDEARANLNALRNVTPLIS